MSSVYIAFSTTLRVVRADKPVRVLIEGLSGALRDHLAMVLGGISELRHAR